MRFAAFISSFNSRASLPGAIDRIRAQMPLVEDILVVDNNSSDGSAEFAAESGAQVLRHSVNLGTSGAAATAFKYAAKCGYDWLWVLDADSAPRPDAFEKLVNFLRDLDEAEREKIGVLSSLSIDVPTGKAVHGLALGSRGDKEIEAPEDALYYDCDATAWTGSLYNISAVGVAGLPRFGDGGCWDDFCLDWGDLEYCYRLRTFGYRVVIHQQSRIDHNIGTSTGRVFFRQTRYTTQHSALRRYLYFRNMTYFWLYIYQGEGFRPRLLAHCLFTLLKHSGKILIIENDVINKLYGSWLGTLRGIRKDIRRPLRYN